MNSSPRPWARLGWYASRLGTMTPAEMLWRGRRLAGQRIRPRDVSGLSGSRLLEPGADWSLVASRFRAGVGRPLLLDRSRAAAVAASHPEAVASLIAAAERVRDGHVTYFGYTEVHLTNPVKWNYDPVRDFHWPLRDSNRLDHRIAVADPKWIWELNRLQHLPWLAEAWLFTGDDSFAEVALDQLDSWIDQNPVGYGIAWRGAFEAGIRAISVAIALQGLRDADALTPRRLERSVRMLAASADRCWRDRSRFSSANNHLIGEMVGLATVASLFPELALASRWHGRALQVLDLEASRQILPDGAGAEQAVGYQVFTAELMLLVAALHRSQGEALPVGVHSAIHRSANYLRAVVGRNDPDPRYGDDDEGFAVRLGPEPRRTVRDHLGIVGALTGDERTQRAGNETLSAWWVGAISGTTVAEVEPDRAVESPPQNFFAPHGGLVVLRTGSRRLTVDVGPLGHLSIAAHGHADALAVTLSVGGQEVIGDPGAASYYGHPEWRQVHRATRVHPTVTVDNKSQSVSGGPFLWSEHAHVRVRAVDLGRGIVDAEHDGYGRLDHPVMHRRWVLAPPVEDTAILIVDELSGSGEHEVRVSWPLHPSLGVHKMPQGHLLTRGPETVAQIATAATTTLDLDEVRGDETEHLGWWSDRLEARVPSWLISARVSGTVPLVLATVIHPSGAKEPAITDVTVSREEQMIKTSWCSENQRHTAVIRGSGDGVFEFASVPAV